MKSKLYERLNAWVEGETPEAPAAKPAPAKPAPKRRGLTPLTQRLNAPDSMISRTLFGVLCFMACAVFALVMLYTVSELPTVGAAENPTDNELSERYIEQGIEDVGAANLVTNITLVYRGFDTYGESCVLFLAATCVIMLLRKDKNNTTEKDELIRLEDHQIEEEESSLILRQISSFIIPLMMLFGLYVLLNGHLSPGGGFAGGSILGGALILCDNAFGSEKVATFFGDKIYHIIKIGALVLYAVLICYTIFVGANGLPNRIPLGIPGNILSAGIILPINVAVGLEVACTMYAFYAFFSKGEL